jgi:hypothetical protein
MKVIFLDFDGVLNTESFLVHFFKIMEMCSVKRPEAKQLRRVLIQDDYGNLFDPLCMNQLEWVLEMTDAKIVISSSWRNNGIETMRSMWKDRQYKGEIYDVTPYFWGKMRGEEIAAWLSEHPEVTNYVILDDDTDMLESQKNNFLRCNDMYGITNEIAKRAVEILNQVVVDNEIRN